MYYHLHRIRSKSLGRVRLELSSLRRTREPKWPSSKPAEPEMARVEQGPESMLQSMAELVATSMTVRRRHTRSRVTMSCRSAQPMWTILIWSCYHLQFSSLGAKIHHQPNPTRPKHTHPLLRKFFLKFLHRFKFFFYRIF